jgi:hypothetical protein
VVVSPDAEFTSQLYIGASSAPLRLVTSVSGQESFEPDDAVRVRLLALGAAPRLVYESNQRLVVADLATGSRLLSARIDDFFNVDVRPDGRVVRVSSSGTRASPGRQQLRAVRVSNDIRGRIRGLDDPRS